MFISFLPCSLKPRVLLLSLVAFFCLILSLYNTTTEGRRLPRIHNIRTLCYMLQELLHTVTFAGHAVTHCYILLHIVTIFFLTFVSSHCYILLHIVTKCWSVLSVMVAMVQTTTKLPRLPAVYMQEVVTSNNYLDDLVCCLPEPQLDSCHFILRQPHKTIFIRFSGFSCQGARELLLTAESLQYFLCKKKTY